MSAAFSASECYTVYAGLFAASDGIFAGKAERAGGPHSRCGSVSSRSNQSGVHVCETKDEGGLGSPLRNNPR